jgi:hypothetical protein
VLATLTGMLVGHPCLAHNSRRASIQRHPELAEGSPREALGRARGRIAGHLKMREMTPLR